GERYLSHRPARLVMYPFLNALEQDDASRGVFECQYDKDPEHSEKSSEQYKLTTLPATETKASESFVSNARMDYELRPPPLNSCCLYDFNVCWQKTKRAVGPSVCGRAR